MNGQINIQTLRIRCRNSVCHHPHTTETIDKALTIHTAINDNWTVFQCVTTNNRSTGGRAFEMRWRHVALIDRYDVARRPIPRRVVPAAPLPVNINERTITTVVNLTSPAPDTNKTFLPGWYSDVVRTCVLSVSSLILWILASKLMLIQTLRFFGVCCN